MRDVGEGAAMMQGGFVLQRLHQIGRQPSFNSAVIEPCALSGSPVTALRSPASDRR